MTTTTTTTAPVKHVLRPQQKLVDVLPPLTEEVAAMAPTAVTASAPPITPRGMFKLESVQTRARYLKILIYGDYGAGKTTLSGTATDVPAMNDVLFINAEAGDLSLAQRADDLDTITITNYTQFARIYEFLRAHCRARDQKDNVELARLEGLVRGCLPEEVKKPRHFRTVIIDSLSEVQRYCMMSLLGVQLEKIQLDVTPGIPEFKEWGQSADMIRTLVRAFRDLPMNVIFVCSQKAEQDEQKKYHYTLHLPGKLANDVQGFLDIVGYLAVGNTPISKEGEEQHAAPRRLFLAPTTYFSAKSRINGRIQFIDDPTIAKILQTR